MQEVFVCIKENDIISRHTSQCKIPRRRKIVPPRKFVKCGMIFRRHSCDLRISCRRDNDDLIRRRCDTRERAAQLIRFVLHNIAGGDLHGAHPFILCSLYGIPAKMAKDS